MKKGPKAKREPEMRDEYDFSRGVRGKHAMRYAEGTYLVLIAPDVAPFFPNAEAVNTALRDLVRLARKSTRKPTGRPRS